MFFIVGWGHQTKKTFGPVQEVKCPNCNNVKHWILEKATTWVTLFFIPIIPSSVKRYTYCPICGFRNNLNKEEFDSLSPLASLNKEAVESNMSQEDYESRLNNNG